MEWDFHGKELPVHQAPQAHDGAWGNGHANGPQQNALTAPLSAQQAATRTELVSFSEVLKMDREKTKANSVVLDVQYLCFQTEEKKGG